MVGEESSHYDIVYIIEVKAGYARMGMATYVVQYSSALAHVINDSKLKNRFLKTLARDNFLESYEEMTDQEELSEILGMQALSYYA